MRIKRSSIGLLLISVVTSIIFSSCTTNYCRTIELSINDQCDSKEECDITFEKSFDFNWDKLFIFDSMIYPDEIAKELGLEYDGKVVSDGEKLIIFIDDKGIVREQVSRCTELSFVNLKENGVVKINKYDDFLMKRKIINEQEQFLLFKKN